MAKRRMFSLDVVDTDRFLDMPATTQNLYFHLGMRADDDGFVGSPRKIMAFCGAGADDLDRLIEDNYIIRFDNGTCVITEWKRNNYLKRDRYTETVYIEEKACLNLRENGIYEVIDPKEEQREKVLDTECLQNVSKVETQVRLGKDSIDKDSIGEERVGESEAADCKSAKAPPPQNDKRHYYGEYKNVLLSGKDIEKLKDEFTDWEERVERLSEYVASSGKTYKNYLAVIRNWAKRDKEEAAARWETTRDYENEADDLPF